jgi:uncharacterized protein (DUF1330 family)
MAAYLVALVDVADPDAYQEYARRAGAAARKRGIKFLVRGGRTVSLEGPPPPGRVVIVPFENMEAAQAYYDSPDYQEAKSFREGAAKAQFFLVEGPD